MQTDRPTHLVDVATMPGVDLRTLRAFPDSRGRFLESYRESWFEGKPAMIQGNRSDSRAGVLRGLHYHRKQADFWYVIQGTLFVVLADLRQGSPTQNCVSTFELNSGFGYEGPEQAVYIPPGVAHGYYAVTDCTMTYLVDNYYDNTDEFGVAWNDPQLAIPWPFEGDPTLSDRDQTCPFVSQLDQDKLPVYE
jgi:dTDP-4-dehydrorhamnose 3,5-epimerase